MRARIARHVLAWRIKRAYKRIDGALGPLRVRWSTLQKQTMRSLWGRTAAGLSFSLTVTAGLYLISPICDPFAQHFGLHVPSGADYVALLTTISSIGGVFIGLYYATIGTITSTTYAGLPMSLRNELFRDRVGNNYMGWMACMTAIGLMLAAASVIGLPRIVIAVPFMALIASGSAIGFVILGIRIFAFFNPAELSTQMVAQIQGSFRATSAPHRRFEYIEHQRRCRERADRYLVALATLTNIIDRRMSHLKGEPICKIGHRVVDLLINYQEDKNRIPTESLWYPRKFEHPEWGHVSDLEENLMKSAGLRSLPNAVIDHNWLEQKLLPIVIRCFKSVISEPEGILAAQLLWRIQQYARTLAAAGELEDAMGVMDAVFEALIPVIAEHVTQQATDQDETFRGELFFLNLVESIARTPEWLLGGFHKHWESLRIVDLGLHLNAIRWRNPEGIYNSAKPPTYLLSTMEALAKQIHKEVALTGAPVMPLWAQKSTVKRALAKRYVAHINFLGKQVPSAMRKWASRLESCRFDWGVAAVRAASFEYLNDLADRSADPLEQWDIHLAVPADPDPQWPSLDRSGFHNGRADAMDALTREITAQSLELAHTKRSRHIPDYAGQFFDIGYKAAVKALILNDKQTLTENFAFLFAASTKRAKDAQDAMKAEPDMSLERALELMAPLIDIMELSGLAILMAEYHGNNLLWKQGVAHALWRTSIEHDDFILHAPSFMTEIYNAIHRDQHNYKRTIRQDWFARQLAQIEDLEEIFGFNHLPEQVDAIAALAPESYKSHASPLIRHLAREKSWWNQISMLQIFYGAFVTRQASFQHLALHPRVDDLNALELDHA
ncbi:hypothetical protein ATO7_06250 [Oceanococcus atlanticus]|uniref:Uncharacterized protein n=1 Tax=Oceanococcus atlanticus TaxID=1317117 RepID=A0A1Y1SJT2_9GAMM|nr:hypothetical protein [Oceanococcus atlanticus]ORE89459.1 hypothetical protein ATO7_06250 [Oceanococcus atlanticus]